ncbi:hypothetical protein A9Z42_0081400 [Trichoderma parareesei]|uniref:Uncharacterized protein n=1 Tax=Trichoderma parareesei TaxID=858221 RepID=A0A2H2ZDC3_TRIPA|nr:hypothetical protein A9Z42_0081400 [Trichoderma parareesei]
MDLGTGTGIWAYNVVEEYAKDAEIMAVDLNQIQPALHLAPGVGYVEQLEIDWMPRWENDDLPIHSALREWAQLFQRAMHRYHRSVTVSGEATRRRMEAAGFTDFSETTIRCYVNPWSPDRHQRECARWFNLAFSLGLEAMSMMPMIDKLGMTKEDIVDLCSRAKKEMCILRYRAYCTL